MNACHNHEFSELSPSDGEKKNHHQMVVYSTMKTTTTTTATFGGNKGPLVPLLAINNMSERCVIPETDTMMPMTTTFQGGNNNCTMLSHRQQNAFMSTDHFQHNRHVMNEPEMKKRTANEYDIKRPRIQKRCKPKLQHGHCFRQTGNEQTRMCGNENNVAAPQSQDNLLVLAEQPEGSQCQQQPPLEWESYLHPQPLLPQQPRAMVVRKEDACLELDCHMLTKVHTTKQSYLDYNSTTGADPDEPVPNKKKKKRRKQQQHNCPG